MLIEIGGDEGNRTLDPLLAGQVLSQLSYTPILLGLFSQDSFYRTLTIEQQKTSILTNTHLPEFCPT